MLASESSSEVGIDSAALPVAVTAALALSTGVTQRCDVVDVVPPQEALDVSPSPPLLRGGTSVEYETAVGERVEGGDGTSGRSCSGTPDAPTVPSVA